jgi:hypothetical protein
MFKVGDKSESVTADRDGSRGRILMPETVQEQAIHTGTGTMYCCIDVSAKSLTVAIQRLPQPVEQESFPNNANGHRSLIVWLPKAKSPVRVSLEATGIYSLDLAFVLDAAEGIEVAVLNPKVANRFGQTIRRRPGSAWSRRS